MKAHCLAIICLLILYLQISDLAGQAPNTVPRVTMLTIVEGETRTLNLCPGYTTSIRLPQEISSVVVGDPEKFKAEHSSTEPRLVFLKPLTNAKAESNALITTRSGQEVSLHLVSACTVPGSRVDFLVEYSQARSMLIRPSESLGFDSDHAMYNTQAPKSQSFTPAEKVLGNQQNIASPEWQGKGLEASIGQTVESEENMIVGFSILNASEKPIEILPPQVQLRGTGRKKKQIKADPVPVSEFRLTAYHLEPGERTDGIVVFEHPAFKEASERLELAIAASDAVDRPTVVVLPFTPSRRGGGK